MHPRVVNVRAPGARWDVYVGRGRCPSTGSYGKWGNPFTLTKNGPEAMRLFIDWLGETWDSPNPGLREAFRDRLTMQLEGRVLGCWCAPGPCHAEVLARLMDGEELSAIRAGMLRACGLEEAPRG